MLSVKTKGYMRNQKKNLYLALMMVGGSREGFKKVVTFEMSLGNSEDQEIQRREAKDNPGREKNAGKGTGGEKVSDVWGTWRSTVGKKKAAREICGDMKKRKADIKYHITKGLNARVRRQIQLKRQGKALHYFEQRTDGYNPMPQRNFIQ